MRKELSLLVILFISITFNSSCSKKDDSPSIKSILIKSTWYWSTRNIVITYTDHTSTLIISSCNIDDYYTFSSDGTYIYNVGSSKCSVDEPNSDGSWNTSTDGKKLTVDDFDFTVKSITSTSISLSIDQTIVDEVLGTYTVKGTEVLVKM
jgi:hypothetical protein